MASLANSRRSADHTPENGLSSHFSNSKKEAQDAFDTMCEEFTTLSNSATDALSMEEALSGLEQYLLKLEMFTTYKDYPPSVMTDAITAEQKKKLDVAVAKFSRSWHQPFADTLGRLIDDLAIKQDRDKTRKLMHENVYFILGDILSLASGHADTSVLRPDRREYIRFRPRLADEEITDHIHTITELYHFFQVTEYFNCGDERPALFYFIWKYLKSSYERFSRSDMAFPTSGYSLEDRFFLNPHVQDLFDIAIAQHEYQAPVQIENLVAYYCAWLDANSLGLSLAASPQQSLNDDSASLLLWCANVEAGIDGSDRDLVQALHWVTLRLNYLCGGPVLFRRYTHPLSMGMWYSSGHPLGEEQLQQLKVEDMALLHRASVGARMPNVARAYGEALLPIGTDIPKSEPTVAPRPPKRSSISAVTDDESVSMDLDSDVSGSPIRGMNDQISANDNVPTVGPVYDDKSKDETADQINEFNWPVPRGKNICSSFDYVWNPFPENRALEVANSRRIARDLAMPGIFTEGLRTKDVINLPPPHCRTPGTYTPYHYKKRTPLGLWDLVKMLVSSVGSVVTRNKTKSHGPVNLPRIFSRAASRHYKHSLAPRRDHQTRITKQCDRRPIKLRGGGSPPTRPSVQASGGTRSRLPRERAPDSPTPRYATDAARAIRRLNEQRDSEEDSSDEMDEELEEEIEEDSNDDDNIVNDENQILIHEDSTAGSTYLGTPPGGHQSPVHNDPVPGDTECHPCPIFVDQYHHVCQSMFPGGECLGLRLPIPGSRLRSLVSSQASESARGRNDEAEAAEEGSPEQPGADVAGRGTPQLNGDQPEHHEQAENDLEPSQDLQQEAPLPRHRYARLRDQVLTQARNYDAPGFDSDNQDEYNRQLLAIGQQERDLWEMQQKHKLIANKYKYRLCSEKQEWVQLKDFLTQSLENTIPLLGSKAEAAKRHVLFSSMRGNAQQAEESLGDWYDRWQALVSQRTSLPKSPQLPELVAILEDADRLEVDLRRAIIYYNIAEDIQTADLLYGHFDKLMEELQSLNAILTTYFQRRPKPELLQRTETYLTFIFSPKFRRLVGWKAISSALDVDLVSVRCLTSELRDAAEALKLNVSNIVQNMAKALSEDDMKSKAHHERDYKPLTTEQLSSLLSKCADRFMVLICLSWVDRKDMGFRTNEDWNTADRGLQMVSMIRSALSIPGKPDRARYLRLLGLTHSDIELLENIIQRDDPIFFEDDYSGPWSGRSCDDLEKAEAGMDIDEV